MARAHGQKGRLYMAITAAGQAEPVAFINSWSLNLSVDNVEVTAFGDTNKVYVAGLPDASGSFAGFYDDATAQMYTAATDGVARRFYLYTNTTDSTKYFFGTALFDYNVETGVGQSVNISGDFQAASPIIKVG